MLRWLSLHIISLHHPLTNLKAWSPDQILPMMAESLLMDCAAVGEQAGQVLSNLFKKQCLPRLTRCTVVWCQLEIWAGKQLASSN